MNIRVLEDGGDGWTILDIILRIYSNGNNSLSEPATQWDTIASNRIIGAHERNDEDFSLPYLQLY